MDAHGIYLLLIAAIPIVGLITNVFGALDKLIAAIRWVLHTFRGHVGTSSRVPTKTMIAIVEAMPNALYWGTATVVGKPGLQLVADFNVTNIWDGGHVRLLVGLLRYRRWFIFRKVVETKPFVRDPLSGLSGSYVIHARGTTHVRMNFMFAETRVPKAPNVFVADVGFVDQFNNRHWLRGLRFKHPSQLF